EFTSGVGEFGGQLSSSTAVVCVDEASSFQCDVEHRLQGVVEYWIARAVCEVRHKDAQRSVSYSRLQRFFQLICNHGNQQQGDHKTGSSRGKLYVATAKRTPSRAQSPNPDGRGSAILPRLQSVIHFTRRLKAVLWLDFETFCDDVTQSLGNSGIELANGNCGFLGPLEHRSHSSLGLVGEGAGEDFLENDPQCEEIGAHIHVLSADLFRRHIFGRADKGSGLRHSAKFKRTRDTEVHH